MNLTGEVGGTWGGGGTRGDRWDRGRWVRQGDVGRTGGCGWDKGRWVGQGRVCSWLYTCRKLSVSTVWPIVQKGW